MFESGYPLRPLAIVAAYINQYKHLPGVPSTDQWIAIFFNRFIIVADVVALYPPQESDPIRWILYANSMVTTLLIIVLAVSSSVIIYYFSNNYFMSSDIGFSFKSDINLFLAIILITASMVMFLELLIRAKPHI